MPESSLLLPSGLHWSCHNSGRCCSDWWEIPVGEEDVRRIRALPLEQAGLTDTDPFEPSPDEPERLALRRRGQRCGFLTEDCLCGLHAQFGAASKPERCQTFPFHFVNTPAGSYVGLSFVCPSVIANKGAALDERREWLQGRRGSAFSTVSAPDKIELTDEIPLEWEEYQRIEDGLSGLLCSPGAGFEDRLIAGSAWLGMLELFLREAAKETNHEPKRIIGRFTDAMKSDDYQRALRIARHPVHSPALQRMFLGMLISFRNTLSVRRGRAGAVASILWNYARHGLRAGRVRLLPMESAFSYRRFRKTTFDARAEGFEDLLTRYFTHSLFRKDLVRRGNVAFGYNYLLILYAMIRWFAVALASERGGFQVELEDLTQAISLTEQYYGAHSDFLDLFRRYPLLGSIFDHVSRRKNFAHSMVRSGF